MIEISENSAKKEFTETTKVENLEKEISHYKQTVDTQRQVIIKLSEKVSRLTGEVNERRFKGIRDKSEKSKA